MLASSARFVTRRSALRSAALNASAVRAASTWANVPQGPPDAILGITEAWRADPAKHKINLGVGAYRTDEGKPYVLQAVSSAEDLIRKAKANKEYAPITGNSQLCSEAAKLAYGPDSPVLGRLAITQSLSGTGALRIGGDFLARFYPGVNTIYIPNQSWANHAAIFKDSGFAVQRYRYLHEDAIFLDIGGLLDDISFAPHGSIFLFHACAHNPTGVDPTQAQWKEIEAAVKDRGHFAFFDMAYQGFASGDIDRDAFALRYFVQQGHNVALAQSFAKNMGLYGERVGTFSIVTNDTAERDRVLSQIKMIIRPMYSNPPIHGAGIAHQVLVNPELRAQWLKELKGMADRIITMRALLRQNLEDLGSRHHWNHITSQIGMFAYTGLSPEHMDALAREHSIYATRDGRFSVAGITTGNVERLAEAIYKVKG